MSADQPDEPTAIDRPPTAETRPQSGERSNAADGETSLAAISTTRADRQVPVTAVEDGRSTTALSSQLSVSVQQAALRETRIAVLQSRVSALEDALEAERDRRRAVVDRYERILDERDESGRETFDDPSLFDRLRRSLSP
jgi:hypothetical protein